MVPCAAIVGGIVIGGGMSGIICKGSICPYLCLLGRAATTSYGEPGSPEACRCWGRTQGRKARTGSLQPGHVGAGKAVGQRRRWTASYSGSAGRVPAGCRRRTNARARTLGHTRCQRRGRPERASDGPVRAGDASIPLLISTQRSGGGLTSEDASSAPSLVRPMTTHQSLNDYPSVPHE